MKNITEMTSFEYSVFLAKTLRQHDELAYLLSNDEQHYNYLLNLPFVKLVRMANKILNN